MQMENTIGRSCTVTVTLSPRENDVARLLRMGLTNREIGNQLGITEGTVLVHIKNIRMRTSTVGCSRVELALALRG